MVILVATLPENFNFSPSAVISTGMVTSFVTPATVKLPLASSNPWRTTKPLPWFTSLSITRRCGICRA